MWFTLLSKFCAQPLKSKVLLNFMNIKTCQTIGIKTSISGYSLFGVRALLNQ